MTRLGRKWHWLDVLWGISAVTCLWVGIRSAQAQPQSIEINGNPSAVDLRVQSAPMRDVLAGLAMRFGVELQGHEDMDEPISGVYRGPLDAVVARILGNSSYLLVTTEAGKKITVFGSVSPGERTAQPPTVATKAGARPDAAPPPVATRKAVAGGAPPLSPAGQNLALKLFGPDAPTLQIDEQFLNAYAARAMRGNTRPRN